MAKKKKKLHQLQIMIPLQWCLITVESDNRETPEIDIISNWSSKVKKVCIIEDTDLSLDKATYKLDNEKVWDSIDFLGQIIDANLDDYEFIFQIETIIEEIKDRKNLSRLVKSGEAKFLRC